MSSPSEPDPRRPDPAWGAGHQPGAPEQPSAPEQPGGAGPWSAPPQPGPQGYQHQPPYQQQAYPQPQYQGFGSAPGAQHQPGTGHWQVPPSSAQPGPGPGGVPPGSPPVTRQPVFWVVIALVAAAVVAVLAVAAWLVLGGADDDVAVDDAAGQSSGDPGLHVLSDAGPEAPVLVEYLDFECPACAAWYPEVETLRDRYGDDVTFAVALFPLAMHANAENAALAAEAAAQQGRFEDMYRALFENQVSWSGAGADGATAIRDIADGLGLDMDAYDAAIEDPRTAEIVAASYQRGVDNGVTGTPNFFLDGRKVDATGPAELELAIQEARR